MKFLKDSLEEEILFDAAYIPRETEQNLLDLFFFESNNSDINHNNNYEGLIVLLTIQLLGLVGSCVGSCECCGS